MGDRAGPEKVGGRREREVSRSLEGSEGVDWPSCGLLAFLLITKITMTTTKVVKETFLCSNFFLTFIPCFFFFNIYLFGCARS